MNKQQVLDKLAKEKYRKNWKDFKWYLNDYAKECVERAVEIALEKKKARP